MALVVVDDFDIGGPVLSSSKTDAPLIIDPDGVLTMTVVGWRFAPVLPVAVVEITCGTGISSFRALAFRFHWSAL
jgi:hypothetical protein